MHMLATSQDINIATTKQSIVIHNDIRLLNSIASLITIMLSQADRLSTYQPISRQPALAPFIKCIKQQ